MSKTSPNHTDLSIMDVQSQIQFLGRSITQCRSMDQHGLRVQLAQLKAEKDQQKQRKFALKLAAAIEASSLKVEQCRESLPDIPFSDDLPINQRREEIAELIQNHQVVVVAGETGSGKTTQIPKICLSIGLGCKGLIGHTQPRRIAARTVGKRIADELATPFGDVIGYQVRFADQLSDNTRVKLMTDGVLLSEFQQDKFLNQYEVIIIDEAHERSLNIDFLLGLLKQLLKKRDDLKLIITSATIDLDKFSQYFDNAPIIEVSGRTYPVDVLYQPTALAPTDSDKPDGLDLPESIAKTVAQIIDGEARGDYIANGDILVFCAGEREIRDAAKAIADESLPVEILPLYSRLGIAEQNKVFQPAQKRKVVLATNVAETSITVPGIAYVIDPGVARISRYSFRSKVQRLQVEPISQASANQRKGRCGRVANGVCIRLYSEDDFNARPAFTEAELLRSNLAAVILQLLQLNVHDINQFPFIDKPDNRLLSDGFKLLDELQAISQQRRLTRSGRILSRLPLDPKYARMLLEAATLNCLPEMIVIVAALSIQDPREFPADKQQAARDKHRLFQHPKSDFYSLLQLWFVIEQQRKNLTNRQFKEFCKKHFLSIMRVFEWRDMVRQLRQTVKRLEWKVSPFSKSQQQHYLPFAYQADGKPGDKPGDKPSDKKDAKSSNDKESQKTENQSYESIHRALLSGLLGNIAVNDEDNHYLATRGRKLALFPTSTLAKKPNNKKHLKENRPSKVQKKPLNAKWIMANELIETSRLFAHTAAEIEPDWIHAAGEHMLKYSYSNPKYHDRAGVVKALRRATLYGLTLRDKTAVIYSDIAEQACRQLFIQQALVEGGYERHPQFCRVNKTNNQRSEQNFFVHNKSLIEEIELIEAKMRRRDLLVADTDIYQLYDERIPSDIVNRVQFEQWRKKIEKKQPNILKFTHEQLTLNSIPLSNGNANNENINNVDVKQNNTEANKIQPKRTARAIAIDDLSAFPESLTINGRDLALSYHFDPSDPRDGVTLELPIALLQPFPEYIGDWLVPGLLRDKCIALIKTLPKPLRKRYAPAPNAVDRVLPNLVPENRPLHRVLGEQLKRVYGDDIPEDAWQLEVLEDYYKLNYLIIENDQSGDSVKHSRDLNALKQRYGKTVAKSLRLENAPERKRFEKHGITQWDFGELASQVEYQHQGMTIRAYPMLKVQTADQEQPDRERQEALSTIDLLLHESTPHADYFTRLALVALAKTQLKQRISYLRKELFKGSTSHLPLLSLAPNKQAQQALSESLIDAAIWHCCFSQALARNKTDFETQLSEGNQALLQYALEMESTLLKSVKTKGDIHRAIADLGGDLSFDVSAAIEGIQNQLSVLFADGFLSYTPLHQLKQYSRYLRCIQLRLDNIGSPSKHMPDYFEHHLSQVDDFMQAQIEQAQASDVSLNDTKSAMNFICHSQPRLNAHLIMLEEWRVSIFAQQLKTQYPVSEKRVMKSWNEIISNN